MHTLSNISLVTYNIWSNFLFVDVTYVSTSYYIYVKPKFCATVRLAEQAGGGRPLTTNGSKQAATLCYYFLYLHSLNVMTTSQNLFCCWDRTLRNNIFASHQPRCWNCFTFTENRWMWNDTTQHIWATNYTFPCFWN